MNVMNRKMFKKSRPARDALNQAGGIMDSSPELMQTVQNYPVPGVQNFANGSNVRIPGSGDSPAANARRMRELQEERDLGVYNRNFINRAAGIVGAPFKAFGAFSDDAIAGILSTLGMENTAVNRRKAADAGYNRAGEMAQGSGVVTGGPVFDDSAISAEDVDNTGLSMFPSIEQAGQNFLFGESLPQDTQDFTKNSLPKGLQTSRDSMFREDRMDAAAAQKAAEVARLGFDITNYDSDQHPLMRDAAVAAGVVPTTSMEQASGFTSIQDPSEIAKNAVFKNPLYDTSEDLTREKALYGSGVDPSGMNDYLARIQGETEKEKFERLTRNAATVTSAAEEAKLAEVNAAAANAGSDQFETSRRAVVDSSGIQGEKEVTDVIQKGTPQERQRSLGELMAEFTDNAPKYEGMSRGLAIAKIGFAIAAGQSPNAMTNIARGLSQGADEFIKDKANRDAFDRQLKLSALQYGLGEKSKIDTQSRADRRNLQQMVVGTKGLTIDGVSFAPGENVTLSTEQMLSLPPKTLAGISTVEAYTDRLKAVEDLIKEQKDKGIKHSEWGAVEERYTDSLSSAKEAEIAKTYINNALITISEEDGANITSLTAAGRQIFGSTLTALGIPGGKEYQKLDEFERDLALGLNKIIPLVIGDTQSANSISDRDVGFVIKAFLASGVIDRKGKNGALRYLGDNPKAIANGLQAALQSINTSQEESLAQMTQIEKNYGDVVVKGMNSRTGGQLLENPIAKRQKFFGTKQGFVWDPTANQGKGAVRLREAT